MQNTDRLRGRVRTLADRFDRWVGRIARRYGVAATRFGFAFVFLTFGLQKIALPSGSPVDGTIMTIAAVVWVLPSVPVAWAPTIVGAYEVVLGLCFLRNRLSAATLLFVPHQATAFLALGLAPTLAFNRPAPFAFDIFGAFVLKNVIFVGAFLLLLAHRDRTQTSAETAR